MSTQTKIRSLLEKRKAALNTALKYTTPHNIHKANEEEFLLVCEALAELEAHSSQTILSRDYDALYEHLKTGGEVFCLVDYKWNDDSEPCRDVASVRRREPWRIRVGVRGMEYGCVSPADKQKWANNEANAFAAECRRMNLEWVAPTHPSQTGQADKMERKPFPSITFTTVPDDQPAPLVLAYLRACAMSWEPEVRLLGNLRAMDIVRVVNELEGVAAPLPPTPENK